MQLKDRIAIITGATRGIGKAIALELAKEGADISFVYLKQDDLAKQLEDEIKKIGRKVICSKADVKDFKSAKDVVQKTKEEFGRLDILINNAGIVRDKALMNMEPQDWLDIIETDLLGVINMSRAAIITFLKQKSGNILNISSVTGLTGRPRQTNYAAAKAGVIGFTKALAKEVGSFNVRVNALAPGFVSTDMTEALRNKEGLMKEIPFGRFGTPEEIAKTALFLVSDRASYITGQVVSVDGGLT
jgi:3-oxoacyl-[acyl-carrier protein] reductase